MPKKKKVTKRLSVYLNETDYEGLFTAFDNSTCRTMTEYLRWIILKRPVTTYYRNRSLDEFTEASISLKKDLLLLVDKQGLSGDEKAYFREKLSKIEELIIKTYDNARYSERTHKS